MEGTEVRVADPTSGFDAASASGGGGGATYKLMSPSRLPISRYTCITIPPGLSPTSFLKSPIPLSNVDPSPATGSFLKPQEVHVSDGSSTYSGTTVCFNTLNERDSSLFEFRPHSGSNMVTADLKHERSEQYVQNQGQCQNESFTSSPSTKGEMAVSSNELSLSKPILMATSGATLPAEVNSDEPKQMGQPSSEVQASHSDHKGSGPSMPSDDGYNWRKYGQKHVKGSEFPRSYYKCTHTNCEVKKLFERSHDGQITEIIYKGTHDHPKPLPSRRYSAGTMMSVQEQRSDKVSPLTVRDGCIYAQMSYCMEPNTTPDLSPVANDDNVEGAEGDDNDHDHDHFSKRRKMDSLVAEVTPVVKPIREPRVVVQTLSEVDILDDGYRWRKYGQKVVRSNPNPRSYYKCINAGCPVRKHVERASHDPKAVITTYECKHNHDIPTARTSSSHDVAGPPVGNGGPSRIVSEESETISLGLGVGISSAAANGSKEQAQSLYSELAQSHPHASSSSYKIIQANPVTAYYGALNGGISRYGSRGNPSEGHGIDFPQLNLSSYSHPQNNGSILMGP